MRISEDEVKIRLRITHLKRRIVREQRTAAVALDALHPLLLRTLGRIGVVPLGDLQRG